MTQVLYSSADVVCKGKHLLGRFSSGIHVLMEHWLFGMFYCTFGTRLE